MKPCVKRTLSDFQLQKGEFNWSRGVQGWILSAFFVGYIVTQLPGGWMANKFGAKIIIGGGEFSIVHTKDLGPVAKKLY